jgi:Xaa-Pro dipeptidase
MGVRIAGYCSDVTSTVPANGTFTPEQKEIYNIVLKANRNVIAALKPGVNWVDMHLLAERVILRGLIEVGILRTGRDIEDMISDRVAYYFMPHGLGHLIGLEVHDVGGYLSFTPPRSEKRGLSALRTARYLEENNMVTVEPGIYFIPYLLEKAFADEKIKQYFDEDKTRSYFQFGGIRIEDNVLITKDGSINLTGDLPRNPEDIEKLMKRIS